MGCFLARLSREGFFLVVMGRITSERHASGRRSAPL